MDRRTLLKLASIAVASPAFTVAETICDVPKADDICLLDENLILLSGGGWQRIEFPSKNLARDFIQKYRAKGAEFLAQEGDDCVRQDHRYVARISAEKTRSGKTRWRKKKKGLPYVFGQWRPPAPQYTEAGVPCLPEKQ